MSILEQIEAEMKFAVAKFPTWPDDMQDAFDIVQEEIGEAQKDILQLHYEPEKPVSVETVRKECIQSVCMLLRFIASLDAGAYNIRDKRKEQHSQEGFGL